MWYSLFKINQRIILQSRKPSFVVKAVLRCKTKISNLYLHSIQMQQFLFILCIVCLKKYMQAPMTINCIRHQVHPLRSEYNNEFKIEIPKKRKFCVSFQWIVSIISAIIFTISLFATIIFFIRYFCLVENLGPNRAQIESCKMSLAISFITMLISCVIGCVLGGLV